MLAESWNRLLNVVDWCLAHPRPGIYLRQVDIPGIDTKFIESHKGTLYDLLNLALQTNVIVASATGVSHFNQRFGFRDKPERVRFRVLDPILSPLPDLLMNDQDFTVTSQGFSKITPSPLRVFVTENEVNFLAFPPYHGAWVIFGAGYGFDALKDIEWLKKCDIYYWGDIDTHGFAALDQFRADFPDARSLLMDSATLLQHSAHWVEEHQQTIRILSRLTVDEQRLFEELCCGRWGKSIRLEQEKISMQCLLQSLAMLEPVIQ
jgi:hypothetical protein